jgi:hypothetical protein
MTTYVRVTPFGDDRRRVKFATSRREEAFKIEETDPNMLPYYDDVQVWEDKKLVELWTFWPETQEWEIKKLEMADE